MPFPIYPFMRKVSKLFSNVLDEDNPYLHIAAGVPNSFTLSGSDILSVNSIGGVATYPLTASPNSPSYDAVNKKIVFDRTNTEGLINDAIGVDKFAGDDLPFSFAMVCKLQPLLEFARIWSAGTSSVNISNLNLFTVETGTRYRMNKVDDLGVSVVVSGGSESAGFIILTATSNGTNINMYQNNVKIINGTSFDVGTVSNINQFAIGFLRRFGNGSFIDMEQKEFAFYDAEVSDARLQAWNNDLNSIYNIY